MFFLKDLPSRQMVEGYSHLYEAENIDSIEGALLLMRRASVLVRDLNRYFAAQGLSQLQFLILIVIDREPELKSLSHHEIAARLDVSKPVLSRAIKTLLESGHVKNAADKDDGRLKRLSITPSGQDLLAWVLPDYFELIITHMKKEAAPLNAD